MEQNSHRLRVALALISHNLWGNGLDSLKPIGVDFAQSLAKFADNARFGEPDERLDKACAEYPEDETMKKPIFTGTKSAAVIADKKLETLRKAIELSKREENQESNDEKKTTGKWTANLYPAEENESGDIFTASIDYTDYYDKTGTWWAKIEVHDINPILAENRAHLIAEYLNYLENVEL